MAETPTLKVFCLPDFGKCNGSAIGPGIETALEFLKGPMCSDVPEGTKPFKQNIFGCLDNVPLCVGVCCVPCCGSAVNAHNMTHLTGRTCEDECLLSCVLNCACCLYTCYHAQKRGELRKKYDIQGTPQMDCLMGLCCGGCMVCQEGMELQHGLPDYKIPMCTLDDAAAAHAKINAKLEGDGTTVKDTKGATDGKAAAEDDVKVEVPALKPVHSETAPHPPAPTAPAP